TARGGEFVDERGERLVAVHDRRTGGAGGEGVAVVLPNGPGRLWRQADVVVTEANRIAHLVEIVDVHRGRYGSCILDVRGCRVATVRRGGHGRQREPWRESDEHRPMHVGVDGAVVGIDAGRVKADRGAAGTVNDAGVPAAHGIGGR